MKKKIFSFLLAIAFVLPCLFMLAGCGKEEKKPTAEAVGNDNQLLNEAEQLMDALSPARQEEALRYLRYLASQEGKDMP